MQTVTLYTIVDEETGETVANSCATLEQAHELLALIQADYPNSTFEIHTRIVHIRFP